MKLCMMFASFWVTAFLAMGCRSDASDEPQQRVRDRHNQMIGEYLVGDVAQAKMALEQDIKFLQGETALTPLGHDDLIAFDYDRLYVLEKRAGDDAAAKDSLARARRWDIKAMEAIKMPLPEMRERMNDYSAAKVLEAVNKDDRDLNNGNLPQYLHDLKSRQTNN